MTAALIVVFSCLASPPSPHNTIPAPASRTGDPANDPQRLLPQPARKMDSAVAQRGTKSFAPGVSIHWDRQAVEVEARVVLRDGPLELLLCTAGSKEHESILATSARPQDIFHAMGLVGLESGKPVRWDESGDKLIPPSGQKLALTVHCRVDAKEEVFPIEKWLMTADNKIPPPLIPWVFSGSQTVADSRFGADVEGTVVCLVDFETALISVAASHSADDEQLWLRANPETIPQRGTKCRLLIEAAVPALPDRNPVKVQ